MPAAYLCSNSERCLQHELERSVSSGERVAVILHIRESATMRKVWRFAIARIYNTLRCIVGGALSGGASIKRADRMHETVVAHKGEDQGIKLCLSR